MAEFAGSLANYLPLRFELTGRTGAFVRATRGAKLVVDSPEVLAPPALAGALTVASVYVPPVGNGYLGTDGDSSYPGLDFYERFHVVPRSIDLGNVLSPTSVALQVFSAFTDRTEFWTSFDNLAGDGVELSGAPALPVAVPVNGYFDLTVLVDLVGPAVVDGTLEFGFAGVTISIPITLQRVVLFAVRPELPYDEVLQFATDVIEAVDRTEQRRRLRKNPRQILSWNVLVEDGVERSILENQLFDWQARTFGVPIWAEATPVSAAVTGGSTTVISVGSTADIDLRDGGLCVIWESQTKYDVLNVVSHTATTVTVENAPSNSYVPGPDVELAPLRLAVIDGQLRGSRYRTGAERLRARFRVKDNDVDIADASAYSTLNGKVLLDDPNFVAGQMDEEYSWPVVVIDGGVGLTDERTLADRNRRGSAKTFFTRTRADHWKVRRLMHHLGGRHLSHYLPTFSSDLTPVAQMTSGQTTLAIANVGYTSFVRSRQPRGIIRVVPYSGSAFIRTIQSSTVNSATQETITITSTWPTTLQPSEIRRIEFVEEVRGASDEIRIEHRAGGLAQRVHFPVVTVLE